MRCTCGGEGVCGRCPDPLDAAPVDPHAPQHLLAGRQPAPTPGPLAGLRWGRDIGVGWRKRRRDRCEALRPMPCGAPGPLTDVGGQLLCARCLEETERTRGATR